MSVCARCIVCTYACMTVRSSHYILTGKTCMCMCCRSNGVDAKLTNKEIAKLQKDLLKLPKTQVTRAKKSLKGRSVSSLST